MSTARRHQEHGAENLCAEGTALYEQALRDGRIPAGRAQEAPCLLDFGLLHPCVDDPDRLEPVSPVVALHRLLRASEARIAHERRREAQLAETFERLMRADGRPVPAADTPALRLLSDKTRISHTITEVMAEAGEELLTIQPHTAHVGAARVHHEEAMERDQALLDRGGRIRALYQHTLRHAPTVIGRYDRLRGDVQARTLDEVTERLIIVDRTVAFVPANADRTLALEVRHPALLSYFVTTFDRLWRLATPMYPEAAQPPSLNGITPRQQAIARLLVEGHTDAVIADRLGMNIRTARVHIAKLAATLGSDSRAQLGYLIARSGILDPES
ncbi:MULTISPECIES: LuxR C-terminal-related transcriptional regulator [Streptomyces]|uniref:Helix-turn-helix transcriptional regulator n=2 Tax=Streptomyces TaxID=1883 RepID=A0A2U9P4R5_STRAS|nr:LuxR C-terminal-related transcriptional regulator [Streptomyces actuosus]AWT44493.1 helix-turn-helix transcriptional regulator [Streptomyces actuosus]MBM4820314.1 response regulator transcription factor [Streptomyces actuosus]